MPHDPILQRIKRQLDGGVVPPEEKAKEPPLPRRKILGEIRDLINIVQQNNSIVGQLAGSSVDQSNRLRGFLGTVSEALAAINSSQKEITTELMELRKQVQLVEHISDTRIEPIVIDLTVQQNDQLIEISNIQSLGGFEADSLQFHQVDSSFTISVNNPTGSRENTPVNLRPDGSITIGGGIPAVLGQSIIGLKIKQLFVTVPAGGTGQGILLVIGRKDVRT